MHQLTTAGYQFHTKILEQQPSRYAGSHPGENVFCDWPIGGGTLVDLAGN
jgi:hypothetical protein